MEQKTLIVVCGPTASGKTKLGIELAKARNGEVVSADSMQVYRRMNIGTAKPDAAEMDGIPHHMLSVAEPWENYSVARYVDEATACVEDIFARGKQPIIVGGTGLYIDALCRGRSFAGQSQAESGHRARLQEELREKGAVHMLAELAKVDPEAAERLHPNDEKRILRALEVWRETGKTISQHNRESRDIPPRYRSLTIGLNDRDRQALYRRIDRRVDEMMQGGLEAEVRALLAEGIPAGATAMQAIGYKEFVAAIERGAPVADAAEEIKLRSRQYAKRQLSWFRRDAAIHWHLWEENPNFSLALQHSIQFLSSEGLE